MKALARVQARLPKRLRDRARLIVERPVLPPPALAELLRKGAYCVFGAFIAGLVLLLDAPGRYWRYAIVLATVGLACAGLGVAAGFVRRLPGARIGVARAWERDYLTLEASFVLALLGDREEILDYCAVSGESAGRFGRTRLYLLTNLRVLEVMGAAARLHVTRSLPLRYVQTVEVDRARPEVLSIEAIESHRDVTLAFPSRNEAFLARDAIREAQRHAPVAEPGALALADPDGAGELALAEASGLALSEEDA